MSPNFWILDWILFLAASVLFLFVVGFGDVAKPLLWTQGFLAEFGWEALVGLLVLIGAMLVYRPPSPKI